MMHAAVGVWILSALVCLGRGQHQVDHHHHHHHADDAPSQVTSGNKEFAFHLYRKLAADPSNVAKNIFYSPSSVSLALAALSVGARGETHRQLFAGLGFNGSQISQNAVNEAFEALLRRRGNSSDVQEGTAVFLDDKFQPDGNFMKSLKEFYLTDVSNLDFFQSKESAEAINKYVSDKTHGKIDKLVDELDPSTIMYLVSHIYFKGKWENHFDAKLTNEDIFNVDEKTKVPVQMMNKEDRFQVYHDLAINTTILRLPFNSSYSMLLLLPDNMAELEKEICPQHITKWTKWMKTRKYDVYIPKISIKTNYPLEKFLMEMGMVDMFDPRADLSGISETKNLLVSSVVHQAALDVDEVGATAAAATGLGLTLMSFQHTPVLKFNRPFMLFLTENNTDDILFMGKIINPNK
ncbi:alpha-1-antitrypsin homolog isoform X2 [Stigmatopora nigra]